MVEPQTTTLEAPEINGDGDGASVLTCADVGWKPLRALLERYGLELSPVADGGDLPGSYWGAPEAGLVELRVFARGDTPVHSLLHEACHAICVDPDRRRSLHTEAGGDDDEENGVCYLQILLADHIPGVGRGRLMTDMDSWGYSFRLGSTRAWFERDAEDAKAWLLAHGLIDGASRIVWRLRGT
ncbi:MAG: hypothetical protein AAGD06_03295 [Acidobacteriota bacterium]